LWIQGHSTEEKWIFTTPNPTVLAVYQPIIMQPCFVSEENYQAVPLIFLDECPTPSATLQSL
jgi:hypothetical protein